MNLNLYVINKKKSELLREKRSSVSHLHVLFSSGFSREKQSQSQSQLETRDGDGDEKIENAIICSTSNITNKWWLLGTCPSTSEAYNDNGHSERNNMNMNTNTNMNKHKTLEWVNQQTYTV
jgi:hypothetical protein